MKPKIIIDTLSLLGNLSGIGRYTYEVSKILSKNSSYQWSFFYGYISDKLIAPNDQPTTKSLRNLLIQNKFIKATIRKILFFLAGLFSPQYALYWQPNFIPLKSIKTKKIVTTVHDFSWELYAKFQPQERVKYFKDNFYQQITKCDHIITGSYFTKNEIISRTNMSEEKISVIYHGIDHTLFYPSKEHTKERQKYILAVGSIEPRKNLKNLLYAYAQYDDAFKDEYHLYLVGDKGWENSDIWHLIEALGSWVHYTGYISDSQLVNIYRNASLFVYPSLYEGFGIPPLEAMACGTAVIVSNTSSLPEICGDAAYYIDPLNIASIADGIQHILNNDLLREELIQKGLQHAQSFTWDKSAKEHSSVFEKVLSQ